MVSSPRLSVRVLAILVPLVLAVAISIAYTRSVDHQSDRERESADREWCDVLTIMDEGLQAGQNPNSPFAQAVHRLRLSRCQ